MLCFGLFGRRLVGHGVHVVGARAGSTYISVAHVVACLFHVSCAISYAQRGNNVKQVIYMAWTASGWEDCCLLVRRRWKLPPRPDVSFVKRYPRVKVSPWVPLCRCSRQSPWLAFLSRFSLSMHDGDVANTPLIASLLAPSHSSSSLAVSCSMAEHEIHGLYQSYPFYECWSVRSDASIFLYQLLIQTEQVRTRPFVFDLLQIMIDNWIHV